MLFKLSLRNIRRSLRDYAIYFFTLVIGVSVFYVFNAVDGQAAMVWLYTDPREFVRMLQSIMGGVSIFVAVVLGLLIVYASRFLMKRRSREYAVYSLLGMSKGKISALLLTETLMIGIGSLLVGLIIGVGLSQLMSALVVDLFDADMTDYRFMVSGEAILNTVISFAFIYIVVMIFNSVSVGRMKLIDLIQTGRRSESVKLKNPVVSVVLFVIAAVGLAFSYYRVGWCVVDIDGEELFVYIGIGAVATFLICRSFSGMLLRILMSMKKTYFKGLNSFTFRQLSSKVNTMVFSMTVICLMLFVTICTLSAAFSIRNSLNYNLRTFCPADACVSIESNEPLNSIDIISDIERTGVDIDEYFREYVTVKRYSDTSFTFYDFVDENLININDYYQEIVSVSDYNELMKMYGKETLTLNDDEYILVCNYKMAKSAQDKVLKTGRTITVFGNTLRPKYSTCYDGFIEISSNRENFGFFLVPDKITEQLSGNCVIADTIIGIYPPYQNDKEGKAACEKAFMDMYKNKILTNIHDFDYMQGGRGGYLRSSTRLDIENGSIGVGALATFVGLYIGIVFLIACGAILALKELSESVDSISRYDMLRKIGAEENDISKSLFRQTGIFFLLPLILACVHSVFGMKFATYFLEIFGTEKMWQSLAATSIILLLIYGGYFLVTYFCSIRIIKDNK